VNLSIGKMKKKNRGWDHRCRRLPKLVWFSGQKKREKLKKKKKKRHYQLVEERKRKWKRDNILGSKLIGASLFHMYPRYVQSK